jgi:hypothetical protein
MDVVERLGKKAAAGAHCQSQQRGSSDHYQALNHAANARNARQLGNEKDGGCGRRSKTGFLAGAKRDKLEREIAENRWPG